VSIRWFSFTQLILAVPAAFGIAVLFNSNPKRLVSSAALCVSVAVLGFLMITDSRANIDNPMYNKNVTMRIAFTASELEGMKSLASIHDQYFAGVLPDWLYFKYHMETPLIKEMDIDSWSTKDFSSFIKDMVVIREEVIRHPFYTRLGPYRIDYDPSEPLEEQGFSRIYENGSVSGFLNLEWSNISPQVSSP